METVGERRTILVVDDDAILQEMMRIGLEKAGYRVLQRRNGQEAVTTVREQNPDMVVLDINMPIMDGIEACRRIRGFSQKPILMLTARKTSDDVVTGLDHGADDYLGKPFNMDELLARLRALLRRVPLADRQITVGNGSVQIDQDKREIIVRDTPVDLTPTEYQLLVLLAEHAGKVVEHEHLLRSVWGQEYTRDNDYLKVYIWHLRRKIEEDPRNPAILLTEWGIGYRMVP